MKLLFFLSGLFLPLLISCGDNEKEEKQKQAVVHKEVTSPVASGPVTLTQEEFNGMRLFMRHCNKCHPGGEKGKGPALNDKNLPKFLVHWQVRLGGGDMPKFTKAQISPEHLDQITAFVRRMQKMTEEPD